MDRFSLQTVRFNLCCKCSVDLDDVTLPPMIYVSFTSKTRSIFVEPINIPCIRLQSFQPLKLITCSVASLPTPATSKALATSRSVSLTSTAAHAFVTHFSDTFGEGGSFIGAIDAGGYRVLEVELMLVGAIK